MALPIKKMTFEGQTVKKWINDGAVVYLSEQKMPNLTASAVNYAEYKRDEVTVSAGAWDLSGFDKVTFDWATETTMQWVNPAGVRSVTSVALQLADGTSLPVDAVTDALSRAGSKYARSSRAVVDVSHYSAAQKKTVRLRLTLGSMVSPQPIPGQDRHNATCTITGAVAS